MLFFPWENFSLSLIRLSSLASLGRQLSFFSTIAESEKFPRGKKSSSSFVFLPWKLFSIKEEYIFFPILQFDRKNLNFENPIYLTEMPLSLVLPNTSRKLQYTLFSMNCLKKVTNTRLCFTLGDVVPELFLSPNQTNNQIVWKYTKKPSKF